MSKQYIPSLNKIIFEGECLNNVDPQGLKRIRAKDLSQNQIDKEDSLEFIPWDDKDPFVYRPLLPFSLAQVPKVGEYVLLFYANLNQKSTKNKFYINGIHSSPTKVDNEPREDAYEVTDMGQRNKRSITLYNIDGTAVNPNIEDVWSKPTDISIDGRGNSDIVVKKNSVELRAGKTTTEIKPNVYPIKNDERAFLQLTQYDKKTFFPSAQKRYTLNYKHTDIKKLVEYNIITTNSNQDSHTGSIYIYNLKPDLRTNTKNFDIYSNVDDLKGIPEVQIDFTSYPEQKVINLIDDTLRALIAGDFNIIKSNIQYSTVTISTGLSNYKVDANNIFPFYFRPQPSLYNIISTDNTTSTTQQRLFVGRLMAQIKVVPSDLIGGYGLVYDVRGGKIQQSVPFEPKQEIVIPKIEEQIKNTVAIMGADTLYLLSHKSQKISTGKINLIDTLGGIDETKVSDEIEPKTSSMVRGEELMDLLNIIVKFLLNHVHGYHGLPPDSESIDGVKKDKLFEELLNAEKILNKYIRIN
jgi:hypothetical protein